MQDVMFLLHTFLPLVATLILLGVLRKLWVSRRLPPGPWGVPIFGYLPFLRRDAPYLTFVELARKFGPIYCVQLGQVRAVVLAEIRLIRQAFGRGSYAGRPPLSVTHGIMQGYGIVGSEGQLWKEQRRFLVDTFRELGAHRHSPARQKLQDKIHEEIQYFLKELESRNGSPVDLDPLLGFVFGNIISGLLFGKRFPEDHEGFLRQVYLTEKGFKNVEIMGALNFLPFLRIIPSVRRQFQDVLDSMAETQEFLKQLIDEHRNSLDPNNPRDYLDHFLLEMNRQDPKQDSTFTEKQLMQMLADLFGAGLETSKVTLSWLLLFVAANPLIQYRIHRDIDNVLSPDQLPSLDDIQSLPYIEAVVLESQRLGNIVHLGAPHGSLEDTELEGYHIPKGTMMMALLWSIHMDPQIWPEPEVFDPSRFLNDDGRIKRNDNLIPFSAGRRMCPGEDLARMELLLTATSVFHRFRIELVDEDDVDFTPITGFTLTPKPYRLKVISRKI